MIPDPTSGRILRAVAFALFALCGAVAGLEHVSHERTTPAGQPDSDSIRR